ncbi:OmpA family protein [Oceanibium sediminis]|uniref:OmpA family protein n=1 Tax=Oceanibium sediminis TaxID=2026339 RepID=UPI000DD4BEF1|nr:OmpA family protein [Oceanibium sediminis]
MTFAAAAAIAVLGTATLTARAAVALLEAQVKAKVAEALTESDSWLTLTPNGTVLILSGTARDSAAQIATLSRIGSVAGGISIDDRTVIADEPVEQRPVRHVVGRHSMEILRDGENVTLFGEIPAADMKDQALARRISRAVPGRLTNMLATGPGEEHARWGDVTELALDALDALERVRISVTPDEVAVTGTAPDDQTAAEVRTALQAKKPDGVGLLVTIETPRSLISPFVFRAELGADAPLDVQACSTETEAGIVAILGVVEPAGATASCALGIGAPSPAWDTAVTASLKTLIDLGAGTLDISDSDIALVGPQGMEPGAFEKTMAGLSRALPDGFSLSGTLPPPPEVAASDDVAAPARFTALRTEDGAVRLRGDVTDEVLGGTVSTFAEAQFGFESVLNETAPRPGLPEGWAQRIFGGLEALGALTSGQLEVTEDMLTVAGSAPTLDIREDIESRLRERLPIGVDISLEIFEQEVLEVEPQREIPVALCAEQIDLLLASATITFPPSETEIDETSLPIIDRIADILRSCPGARFEIAGHTDSQGRESSNMALSQARADAVMAALLQRDVNMVFLYTEGYGETDPIADNDTEVGRARNRRIEFRLIEDTAGDPDNPVMQAGVDGPDNVDAARLESPTTIVVPAGTDPDSVLPPSARDAAEDPEAETGDDATEGAAPEAAEPDAAGAEATPEAAEAMGEDAPQETAAAGTGDGEDAPGADVTPPEEEGEATTEDALETSGDELEASGDELPEQAEAPETSGDEADAGQEGDDDPNTAGDAPAPEGDPDRLRPRARPESLAEDG